MTVYEFLIHAARSYSGVVNGGKTEDITLDLTRKSIWSGSGNPKDFRFAPEGQTDFDDSENRQNHCRLCILRNGQIVRPSVRLENGEVCELDGLIDFDGDPYTEIEHLYAQFKRSVPNRHVRLNKGYFKALSSDALTMEELMDNMPRPEARIALEGFILLASVAGLIPWHNPKYFFWQSPTDPECIVYRDWIIQEDGDGTCSEQLDGQDCAA